ncbi:hypothetical protein HUJ04_002198 [Dendroctonus ponderosae]|nr:hypothetical protein HUJ04_002198 [Dendroctonus ponderosae]
MYVIFPADEVVYLSYGRLIVVPVNSHPANSPIRTTALPDRSETVEHSNHSPSDSTIDRKLRENQPSSSRGEREPQSSDEKKPKRKSLRLNFNLLRRGSKKSDTQSPLSLRVRHSVGHKDQAGITTPPSEAFKKFCNISGAAEPQASDPHLPPSREKTPSDQGVNCQEASSQRSSSLVQEDQSSKKSSKRSSSSSKSNKQEKLPVPNHIGGLRRSQSQIQRDTQKEPLRKGSTPTNLTAQKFYPLSTSREKNLIEPSPEPLLRARSSSFRLNFRRSKTPEVPARPDRKKDKKAQPSRPKNVPERKLSFSDYLAVSRDKSHEGRAGVAVSSDREKPPIVPEKSPVLSFFRKTPSPKNLGRDRTPHLSRDSGLYANQYLQEPQFDDRTAGHKHTSDQLSENRLFYSGSAKVKHRDFLLVLKSRNEENPQRLCRGS